MHTKPISTKVIASYKATLINGFAIRIKDVKQLRFHVGEEELLFNGWFEDLSVVQDEGIDEIKAVEDITTFLNKGLPEHVGVAMAGLERPNLLFFLKAVEHFKDRSAIFQAIFHAALCLSSSDKEVVRQQREIHCSDAEVTKFLNAYVNVRNNPGKNSVFDYSKYREEDAEETKSLSTIREKSSFFQRKLGLPKSSGEDGSVPTSTFETKKTIDRSLYDYHLKRFAAVLACSRLPGCFEKKDAREVEEHIHSFKSFVDANSNEEEKADAEELIEALDRCMDASKRYIEAYRCKLKELRESGTRFVVAEVPRRRPSKRSTPISGKNVPMSNDLCVTIKRQRNSSN